MIVAWLITWQVTGQVSNVLIGRNSSSTLWSFWWLGRALWLNYDPAITDYAAFPFEQNLLLQLSPAYTAIYSVLKELGVSAPLSFNSLFLLTSLFTGYMMLLYLRSRNVPESLAMSCSLLLIASPIALYRVIQGCPNLMALGWIPLGCLLWERIRENQQPVRNGGYLVMVGIGATLTGLQILLWALSLWVPYFVVSLREVHADRRRSLIQFLLLLFLVWLAIWLVYPLPGILKTLYHLVPGVSTSSLLVGDWHMTSGIALLALLWICLVGWALLHRGGITGLTWGISGSMFLALALATELGGLSGWQDWFSTADWLSPASISFCLFIALNLSSPWQVWWHGSARKSRSLLKAMLLVGLSWLVMSQSPAPTILWEHSTAYTQIGKESGDYSILSIPFGVRSLATGRQFGTGDALQQYAVLHRKRSLSGVITDKDSSAFNTYAASPLFRYLTGEVGQPNSEIAQELQTTIDKLQIGYLIVRPNLLNANQRESISKFLDAQSPKLCKVFTDEKTIVYRTFWHPFHCGNPL